MTSFKQIIAVAFGSVMALAPTAAKAAPAAPTLVQAPVSHVFIPVGFDDNDNIEVTVAGYFPSSCYKTGHVVAQVNLSSNRITLDVQALRYPASDCVKGRIPYSETVKLGILPAGQYTVNAAGAPRAQLTVATATTSSPDDNTYAPVRNLRVTPTEDGYSVELEGQYPYLFVGCMRLTHVRTVWTPDNVLVVRPIAAYFYGDDCKNQPATHDFKETLTVGPAPKSSDFLVHARALNGEAVNYVYNTPQQP